MSPLPGYRVVPDGWAARHRPTAEAAMPSTVNLVRPRPASSWDPIEGAASTATPPYAVDVPARLQRLPARDNGGESAGQDVNLATYLVPIPLGAGDVWTGDLVVVATNPDDPALEERALLVVDVTYGSVPWQRDLTCTLDLTRHPRTDQEG